MEEFSQGNSGWYKNTSAETVTEEILSSGIGKKYLDTIIKRLAGLYTDREDIVNRFALLSGIVGDSEELLFRWWNNRIGTGII